MGISMGVDVCHHRSPDPWWLGFPFLFSDTISLITQASFFSKLFKSLLEGLNWAVIPPFCLQRQSKHLGREVGHVPLPTPLTYSGSEVCEWQPSRTCLQQWQHFTSLPSWAWNAYSLWACTWCLGWPCPNRSVQWASLTCLQTYLGVYISGTPWSIPLEIVPGF